MRSTSVGWDLCLYGNCPRGKSFVGVMCVNLSFISGRATFVRYRELLRIFMTMNGNDATRRVLHFTFMDRRVKCDSRHNDSRWTSNLIVKQNSSRRIKKCRNLHFRMIQNLSEKCLRLHFALRTFHEQRMFACLPATKGRNALKFLILLHIVLGTLFMLYIVICPPLAFKGNLLSYLRAQ